ncbi:ABC transporter substrate-binding protein [Longispora fulva]|uniref:Multiple sugar transport system substrate-binding protein n=1 Tax=Longispora fulva TaxID=619741 RepID=A0A8J7GQR7_9ACTN|nr:extracellular solute-binding protein [Longispora fulva]MBG6135211.1 multiple sugar transport system substrate-binding protein [Longispora fulva]GIG56554.1 ABC transporter substrate-binding protein [Longispora fulva]
MDNWSRRTVLSAIGLTGVGAALAACGTSSGSAEGTLNVLFMQQAGYSEEDISAMVALFEKDNPKIKINKTFVAYEALRDKIVAAAPAGTFDVVLIDVIWPPEFAEKKLIADITPRVPAEWKTQMLEGALSTAVYKDRFYGVPWILDAKYLYSNTEHLTRAGLAPTAPTTWSGVVEAARAIKAKGVVKYPLIWSWKQTEAVICDYTQLLGAFGGTFLDAAGKPAFNTGGGVRALQFMKSTLDEGLSNPASMESLEDDVAKAFPNGDASFALNWTFMWAKTQDEKESKVKGKVTIGQTPAGDGGKRPGCNGSMALAIPATSKKPDDAWKLIQHLTSAATQEQYAKSSLPVWKASYTKDTVVATSPETVAAAKAELDSLILRPGVNHYNAVSQILQGEISNALLGRKPVQKALDDAAAAAASELK